MIGYTTVGTNDMPPAIAFYDAVFGAVGIGQLMKFSRGIAWGPSQERPSFAVMTPFDGKPATVGNGSMVALGFRTPELVRAIHAKAVLLGGKDEGEPGDRGGNFYGAYFRDLDGNKICAYCITG